MKDIILQELNEAKEILDNFILNPIKIEQIENAANAMIQSLSRSGKIISCGNGGSMSDAMHFAEELTGRFKDNRKSLSAIAISDPGYITCVGNDYGYQFIFSRFVEGIAKKGDVLLAISTSGNSENVIEAAKTAKKMNVCVIGLTGKNGGMLAKYCDFEVRVDHNKYADRIQEMHIKIIHIFISLIENKLIKK